MRETATGLLVADIWKAEVYWRSIQESREHTDAATAAVRVRKTEGEARMRSRTNFRLPVASGAKKKRRHVTETDLGGKIAKAGDQGQSSSLASSWQWKDGWSCWRSKSNRWDERLDDTTSSNSTEQDNEPSGTSLILRLVRWNTMDNLVPRRQR